VKIKTKKTKLKKKMENASPYKNITLAVLVMHTKEDLNNYRGNNTIQ
jgi:hypothetical protein